MDDGEYHRFLVSGTLRIISQPRVLADASLSIMIYSQLLSPCDCPQGYFEWFRRMCALRVGVRVSSKCI